MSMTRRLTVLKRLETMYGLVEELHSVTLRQAAAKMLEAETAIGEELGRMRDARADARTALGSGDREGWMVAEAQRELSGELRDLLETVRVERGLAAELAQQAYRASRLRREQMKSVVDEGAEAAQVFEGRRAQAAADDRFLSRMHWNRLRFEAV